MWNIGNAVSSSRIRDVRWLACAALMVAATACGSTTTPSTTTVQQASHPDGQTRVVSVPWTLISAQGRAVTLRWIGGGCLSPDYTNVVERVHTVTVTVHARLYLPGKGESCTSDAILYTDHLRLRTPLARRELRHARVNRCLSSNACRPA